ncbi:MAG: V-type ATP synthase subunit I [Clostridiales bacterium]|nr:V-type ATP synthase subunit I [Clostridiales bacterium]
MLVPMKRLTLIALHGDKDGIMSALQDISAVQIISSKTAESDNSSFEEIFSGFEEGIRRFREVHNSIKDYAKKPGMLTPKREVEKSLLGSQRTIDKAVDASIKIESQIALLSELKAKHSQVLSFANTLKPWLKLQQNIEDIKSTRHTEVFCAFIPDNKISQLSELPVTIVVVDNEAKNTPCIIACHKSDYDDVVVKMHEVGAVEFTFQKDLKGNVIKIYDALLSKANAIELEIEQEKQEFEKMGCESDKLLLAIDALNVEYERQKAKAELLVSNSAFILDGWARSDEVERIQKTISEVTDAFFIDFADPKDDETPPTVVKNNKFNAPFEAITNMFSLPNYRGIDATPLMAPFYLLFFGLMLSDSGYGLVLYILCTLYLKLKKPKGTFAGIVQVIAWGGLVTIVCGFLVGTFFGLSWNKLFFGTAEGPFPLLFDPLKNTISMMLFCCGLGVVQMMFALGLNAYMQVKSGDTQAAIFDSVSWIFLVLGLIGIAAVPNYSAPFMVLALIGGLLILFFAGREKKNIFGRLGSGAGALYGVSGYLGDTVSYSRIFAMGLVTGAMGEVFNLLGSMLAGAGTGVMSIFTTLFAIVVLVVLHGFSLFINTLGSFSHTARLQYVEFFGKFYATGGIAFKPLGYHVKHVDIEQDYTNLHLRTKNEILRFLIKPKKP